MGQNTSKPEEPHCSLVIDLAKEKLKTLMALNGEKAEEIDVLTCVSDMLTHPHCDLDCLKLNLVLETIITEEPVVCSITPKNEPMKIMDLLKHVIFRADFLDTKIQVLENLVLALCDCVQNGSVMCPQKMAIAALESLVENDSDFILNKHFVTEDFLMEEINEYIGHKVKDRDSLNSEEIDAILDEIKDEYNFVRPEKLNEIISEARVTLEDLF